MDLPDAKYPAQMLLPERNQEIQALAAQAAEEPFTIGIRLGRPDRCAENPDTHRGHSRIQPGRVDAVAIVEDEAIAVRFRENLPELL
jgi:hypothetical protein